MISEVQQRLLIDNLNKYLEWHNLPVRMNKSGICNGLASVYAKYALENKEKKFLELLQYVAGKDPSSEIEIELNHFVAEILVSFIPQLFNQKLNVLLSTEALAINNRILKSAFNFAITTSDTNWAEIIRTIDLKNTEVMRVVGAKHAVSVSKKGGKFIIYDPNYSSGIKEFANEDELIQELHKNVFHFEKGNLAMAISVIPHPDNIPRAFPKIITKLYDKYLAKEDVTAKPVTSHGIDASENTLFYAAIFNDGEVIKHLLATGAEDKDYRAAMIAAESNNISALEVLIVNIKDSKTIKNLLTTALQCGEEEVLEVLLKNTHCQQLFNKELLSQGAIHLAAESGNPQLLKKIINTYKKSLDGISDIDAKISAKIIEEQAIIKAIDSGSVQCVKVLIKQLKGKDQLNDAQKLLYLDEAIRKNQPHMVSYFVQSLSSKESLKHFSTDHFSLQTIEQTDLSILCQLKKEGVPFSKADNLIIAKKEHKSTGLFLSMGIEICKWTEFVKDKLFKSEEKNPNIIKCKEFARKLRDIISAADVQEKKAEQHDASEHQGASVRKL